MEPKFWKTGTLEVLVEEGIYDLLFRAITVSSARPVTIPDTCLLMEGAVEWEVSRDPQLQNFQDRSRNKILERF